MSMSRRRYILRLLEEEEEDEWEDFLMLHAMYLLIRRERRRRWQYERRWNKLLEKLRHQGKFHTRFRMSETAFNDLVELLRPALKRVTYNHVEEDKIIIDRLHSSVPGQSVVREAIKRFIRVNEMRRPDYILARNSSLILNENGDETEYRVT